VSLQTAAEAKANPPRPDLPANVANGTNGASRPAANTAAPASQVGAGGFKVGNIVRIPLGDGKILQVRGREYFVRNSNGVEIWMSYPEQIRRKGKLTAEDHTLGQYDAHDYVQVLVEGKRVEGEVIRQSDNVYTMKLANGNESTPQRNSCGHRLRARLRPRQVRYQAALRPDTSRLGFRRIRIPTISIVTLFELRKTRPIFNDTFSPLSLLFCMRIFHELVAVCALLGIGACYAPAQDLYNRNLIVNGDAEAGPAGAGLQPPSSIPGWKTYAGFTVQAYGATVDAMSVADGPKNCGKNYFTGGNNTGRSYAEQTIALNGLAPGAKFYLSAFMGKTGADLDTSLISLRATFQDDKGVTIQDSLVPGPALETEYRIPEGLQLRTLSGFVPAGASQVKLTLDFGNPKGTSVNGLTADNLSLIFTRDPLTSTNLMVNGDAEAGAGTEVAGWNGFLSNLESTAYLARLDNYELSLQSPGPTDRGKNFLLMHFGGDAGQERRYWQMVEVTRATYIPVIDAGQMRYRVDGWLGAQSGTNDEIKLRVTFLDGKTPATTLGVAEPVTIIARGLDLDPVGIGGPNAPVPQGTRRIKIELILTKRGGAPDDMTGFADNISLVLTSPPQLVIEGIGNAANYVAGKVSPGEILVVYGSDFGPDSLAGYQIANGLFSTATGETRIYFDGVPAPMLYSIAGQMSCIVPYSVAGKPTTQIQAEYRNFKGNILTVPVTAAVPGLFTLDKTGKNQVAALNEDYSVNGSSKPADKGHIVMLFATGEGQTAPGGVDGKPAADTYPKPLAAVTAQVNGKDAEVQYYGAAPGLVAGVMQVNVRVPIDAPSGNVPVVIKTGADSSQSGATIAVR
jgi:uncharacterized protein (TIGR03437 family)